MTHFFKEDEFIRGGVNWYDRCHPRLLVLLDTFRLLTGKCIISPHPLAIGRNGYPKNPNTQHNIEKWGQVMAIDVFPTFYPKAYNLEGVPFEELNIDVIAGEWVHTTKSIGFSGIGLYPQWTLNGKVRPGMHLDVREGVHPNNPATWGYVDGKMVSIEEALSFLAT